MLNLAQMTTGMQDKVAQQIIDIFVRESEILELLPFDNAVSPTGGSTLVYGDMCKKKCHLPQISEPGAVSKQAKLR